MNISLKTSNWRVFVKKYFLRSVFAGLIVLSSFSVVSAAYCTPDLNEGCNTYYISRVKLNGLDNNSAGRSADGYGLFALSTNAMNRNTGYTMEITIIKPTFSSSSVAAYIDWNQDDDFADAGETVLARQDDFGDGTGTKTYSFTVTPPAGASFGNTRIRVGMYACSIGNPIACPASGFSGEYEDYTADVTFGLPIELLYFDAYKDKDKKVALTWETATEINNAYFTIERSTDGINFYTILTVPGAGNSTRTLEYAAFDESPVNGWNYYRLKQTDYDGQYTYSGVKAVLITKSETNCTIYNTPYNALHIHVTNEKKEMVMLTVYDVIGQQVYAEYIEVKDCSVDTVFDMDAVGSLGVYFVKVSGGNNQCMVKVLKY